MAYDGRRRLCGALTNSISKTSSQTACPASALIARTAPKLIRPRLYVLVRNMHFSIGVAILANPISRRITRVDACRERLLISDFTRSSQKKLENCFQLNHSFEEPSAKQGFVTQQLEMGVPMRSISGSVSYYTTSAATGQGACCRWAESDPVATQGSPL